MDNDVALLKLNSPIKYSTTAKKVAIAAQQPPKGAKLKVSGWGATSVSNYLSQS